MNDIDKELLAGFSQISVHLELPPRSMDATCLFEERALENIKEEVKEYLQPKLSFAKKYIDFYLSVYGPAEY